MIRVVLAVVLTTAVLGVSLPAIDDARKDHTDAAVRTELQRVERAATDLLATDDPIDDGARRVIELRFPTRSWSEAGVEAVTIGESPHGSGGWLTWTVTGGDRSVRRLPEIPFRAAVGRNVSLLGSSPHHLVLALDGNESDPVVTVRRFTTQEATSAFHATVASDSNRRTGRQLRLCSVVRRRSTPRRRR